MALVLRVGLEYEIAHTFLRVGVCKAKKREQGGEPA